MLRLRIQSTGTTLMLDNLLSFDSLVRGWIVLAIFTLILLLFVRAPYGRHQRPGWGPAIPARIGWFVMELPSLIIFPIFWLRLSNNDSQPNHAVIILSTLWLAHYFHRTVIWPMRAEIHNKTMPISIAIFAFTFNCVNASINGFALFILNFYPSDWVLSFPFLIGSFLFVFGFLVNVSSDNKLFKLRKNDDREYGIPNGGLYRWVTCPNYLGEILEWIGWAIACWSLAGVSFAIWVIANLAPRARSNHQWYHEKFRDYPKDRKILVPFIW